MRLTDIQNGLADAIRHASGKLAYDVRDDLSGMTDRDMISHYRLTGRVIVSSGFSERTIFGCPKVNWLFRAIAEYAVADYQCIGLGDRLAKIVQCEVADQARYFADTGKFIDDQIAFTLRRL